MAEADLSFSGTRQPAIVLSSIGIQGPAGVAGFFTESGTTHTLQQGNRSKIGKFTNASGITITIPSGLSEDYDVMIVQMGTGQITFSPASGVTMRSPLSANKTTYQYAVANVLAIGPNEVLLTGEVAV